MRSFDITKTETPKTETPKTEGLKFFDRFTTPVKTGHNFDFQKIVKV